MEHNQIINWLKNTKLSETILLYLENQNARANQYTKKRIEKVSMVM